MHHSDKRYAKYNKVVDQITDELQAMVWPDTSKVKRRLSGNDLVKLKLSVGKLIRDSLAIKHSKIRNPFASIRLASGWYKSSRYAAGLTYRIHVDRAFKGMCQLAYLKIEMRGGIFPDTGGFLTRYSAIGPLLKLFDEVELQVLPVIIPQDTEGETVLVKVTESQSIKGNVVETKVFKDYQDTPQTSQMRANLKIINHALSKHWYDLNLDDDEFDKMQSQLLSKEQKASGVDRQINLSKRSLYRLFNDEALTTGGRFYGGWWQEIPKRYRENLVINGKPMAELDYSGLHPAILYLELGLVPPNDPYEGIFPKENLGYSPSPKDFRSCVKVSLNAMLNAKQPMKRPPRGFRRANANCSWRALSEAITERHAAIKHLFYTNQGLRLQRLDSNIAEYVLLHFAKMKVAVLPLHDSFLVHSGYLTELREVMVEAFNAIINPNYSAKLKPLSKWKPKTTEEWEAFLAIEANRFDDEPTTSDIYELLNKLDVGHERRLDAFRELLANNAHNVR